jgi:PAT family beta-lactamase induction signal transducer AmpG
MLSEKKLPPFEITLILLGTFPYSWKFALSPIIKNLIIKFENAKFDVVKILSFALQLIMVGCFASLGYLVKGGYTVIVALFVFILTMSIASYDIVYGHVELVTFKKEELGPVTSIISTGFRLGIFISGAVLLYVAEYIGWERAFFAAGIFIAVCSIPTILIPRIKHVPIEVVREKLFHWDDYIQTFRLFFAKHSFICFVLLMISLKFADSCISTLKPIFLQTQGISRVIFANITHILGLFVTIISGFVAGYCISKVGTVKSMKYALILQCLATGLFVFLPFGLPPIPILALIVNISTFSFGFTNVVYRTYAAEESDCDVNRYVLLLSIGSLVRIGSISVGGFVADYTSWLVLFLLCFFINIPGFFLYPKVFRGTRIK